MNHGKEAPGHEAGRMAAFLFGVARGETVAAAADAAGLAATTLYYRRKRCPVFARCWREAVTMAREADQAARRAAQAEMAGERGAAVRGHVSRLLQRRKPPTAFDREGKQVFLDHFAATCDLEASAVEAGISMSSFYRALQSDPAFSAGFEEALRLGYLGLEAEALREQREAQRAYAIEPADSTARAKSFERTMALLRHYGRTAGGTAERRAERPASRWTFEETIESIETKLKAFGVEVPEAGAEGGDRGPLHRGEEYPDA